MTLLAFLVLLAACANLASIFDWRSHRGFTLLSRLKPGITQQQGSQNMEAIARQMAKEYPDDQGLTLTTRKPGPSGNSDLRGTCRGP